MTGNPPADGGPKRSGRLTDGNSTNQNPIVPSREGTPLQANQNPYFPSHDGFPPVKDGQQPPGELVDTLRTRFPDSDPDDGVHQEWVPEDKQVEWVKDDPANLVQRHLAEQRPQGSPMPVNHGPQMPSDHPVDWSKVHFPGPDGWSGGHHQWNPVTKQVDWIRDPITKAPPTEQIPVPGEHPAPQPHEPWLGPGPQQPDQPVDWSKVRIPDSDPNDGIHQQWVPEHGRVEWVKDVDPGMVPGPQMPSDHPVDWSKVKFPDTDPNDGHHLEYVPDHNRVEWVKDKPPGEVKTQRPDHDQNPGNGDTQHPVSHQPPPGDSHHPNGGVDQVVHQPPQVLTPDKPGLAWVADHGQWKLKWLGDPKKAPLLDNGPYELRVGKDGELQSVYNARDKNQPVRDFDSDHQGHGHHGGHGDDKSGLMVGPDGKVHWVGPSDKAPFVDNGKIHIGKDGAIEFDGADAKTGGLSRTQADGKVLNTDPSAGAPPKDFHGQHRYGMLPDEQDTKIAARHEQGKLLGKHDDPPGKDGGGQGKPHEGDPNLPPGKSQKPHVKSERPGGGDGDKKDGGGGGNHPFDPASVNVPRRPPADGKDGGKGGKGDEKDGGGGEKRPLDPATSTVTYRKPTEDKNGDKNKGKDGGGGDGGPKRQGYTITSPAPGNGGNGGKDGGKDGGKKDDTGGKKDGDGDKKDGAGDKKDGDKKDGDGKDKKPKPLPAVKGPGGSGHLRFNKDDWNKLMSAFNTLNISLVDDATTNKEDGILGADFQVQPKSDWQPATKLNTWATGFGNSVVKVNDELHTRVDKFVSAMSWATEVFEKTDDLANYGLNEFVTEFPDLNSGGGKMGGKGA
ncbi:hypothetical protein [Amycolatopsis sp. CA-230715]|uniref:hypothetical protein n=1 Tax=Amycolatopsis sp. CA-230715 TaxID=2745196 RepID=UPI001C01824F|nr:hypothetical protein [Amycolatopsis sp. CA-230715]QWF82756.1 hypothetical protein HUW46_06195 [Amycolatopsis sp. CA-230715]